MYNNFKIPTHKLYLQSKKPALSKRGSTTSIVFNIGPNLSLNLFFRVIFENMLIKSAAYAHFHKMLTVYRICKGRLK